MINPAKRTSTIELSQIRKMFEVTNPNAINLGIGEPDFDVPENIKLAMEQSIKNNETHYTPNKGYIELREAITQKFKKDNNINTNPENIIVTAGASEALYMCAQAFIEKNDEVILSDDVFPKSHGVYVTTKIYGIEEHTYTLDIYYKGEHHTSTETMIPKTPITDLKIQKFDLDNGKPIPRAPIISFVNQPGVDNYYLFYIEQYSYPVTSLEKLLGTREQWAYSILSDKFLGDEVVDLLVSEGESVKRLYPQSGYPVSADTIFVTLQSLSKACYDIYDKAIEQMRTDGGAYSPTPTSVKSNISGDVWGMFRVSAYSKRYGLVDRKK